MRFSVLKLLEKIPFPRVVADSGHELSFVTVNNDAISQITPLKLNITALL